jgi:hypothetical protein
MRQDPTYVTGEPICKGDMVRIGEWDGVVESVITKNNPDWVDYIGEGVMVSGAAFGWLHVKFNDEDLVIVRRKQKLGDYAKDPKVPHG